MARKKGSRQLILDYLVANVGKVLTSAELQEASGGKAEFARRIRELRNEFGYQILTHNDREDLRPNEYILISEERRPAFKRNVSKELRAFVLERNGYTCQMCGVGAGDADPYDESRTVRLVIGHIVDQSKGGKDEPGNLRAVCTNCNGGLQNISPPKPDCIHLLAMVRRATRDDQKTVLDWLKTKFGES